MNVSLNLANYIYVFIFKHLISSCFPSIIFFSKYFIEKSLIIKNIFCIHENLYSLETSNSLRELRVSLILETASSLGVFVGAGPFSEEWNSKTEKSLSIS